MAFKGTAVQQWDFKNSKAPVVQRTSVWCFESTQESCAEHVGASGLVWSETLSVEDEGRHL